MTSSDFWIKAKNGQTINDLKQKYFNSDSKQAMFFFLFPILGLQICYKNIVGSNLFMLWFVHK